MMLQFSQRQEQRHHAKRNTCS